MRRRRRHGRQARHRAAVGDPLPLRRVRGFGVPLQSPPPNPESTRVRRALTRTAACKNNDPRPSLRLPRPSLRLPRERARDAWGVGLVTIRGAHAASSLAASPALPDGGRHEPLASHERANATPPDDAGGSWRSHATLARHTSLPDPPTNARHDGFSARSPGSPQVRRRVGEQRIRAFPRRGAIDRVTTDARPRWIASPDRTRFKSHEPSLTRVTKNRRARSRSSHLAASRANRGARRRLGRRGPARRAGAQRAAPRDAARGEVACRNGAHRVRRSRRVTRN